MKDSGTEQEVRSRSGRDAFSSIVEDDPGPTLGPPPEHVAWVFPSRTIELLAAQASGDRHFRLPIGVAFLRRRLEAVESWLESFVGLLRSWALVDLLQLVAAFGIVVTGWQFWAGRHDRRKVAHYVAWQVINSAQGKGGSGGRIEALQDLAADDVSLTGVRLDGAWLEQVQLDSAELGGASFHGARVVRANFHDAYLVGANFQGAELWDAHLQEAALAEANLQGARLMRANLQNAWLGKATLQNADLTTADLQNADLSDANLQGANLYAANLQHAKLMRANLQGVDLSLANLQYAELGNHLPDFSTTAPGSSDSALVRSWREIKSLDGANISGVRNAPPGFRQWAIDTMGAVEERTRRLSRGE